jgi:LAS superfamily LD-carboxypeptidase LdcB
MQVFDPRKRDLLHEPAKKSRKARYLPIFIAAMIASAIITYLATYPAPPASNGKPQEKLNQDIQQTAKQGKLKNFSGQQFKELYENFAYPNTVLISEDTPITGNPAADTRIRQMAVKRGYKLRAAPVADTFQEVSPGHKLQQRAAQPWLEMKTEAEKDGVKLGITAAYRSADDQKAIFVARLAQAGIPIVFIGSGAYDAQLNQLLSTTAIPGYSRHHSGYTIDISCENEPNRSFQYTVCFDWLNANNYEKTKKHGWIPSYPENAEEQGPEPESWEYVWVGTDAVTE